MSYGTNTGAGDPASRIVAQSWTGGVTIDGIPAAAQWIWTDDGENENEIFCRIVSSHQPTDCTPAADKYWQDYGDVAKAVYPAFEHFMDCPGLPGRLSTLKCSYSKYFCCGAFVWARTALSIPFRAVSGPGRRPLRGPHLAQRALRRGLRLRQDQLQLGRRAVRRRPGAAAEGPSACAAWRLPGVTADRRSIFSNAQPSGRRLLLRRPPLPVPLLWPAEVPRQDLVQRIPNGNFTVGVQAFSILASWPPGAQAHSVIGTSILSGLCYYRE
jgi:hypothetical protein